MSTVRNQAPYHQARRRVWKESKACVWCGTKIRKAGATLCHECRAVQRERYEELKAEGLCTICQGPSDGGWACGPCRDKKNEQRRRRRAAGLSAPK